MGLRDELLHKRAELDEDDGRTAMLDRQLLDLDHLREVALEMIEMLAALPQRATWGEWLQLLRALTALGVRDAAPVLAVLAELEPMAPVGPIGLEEVRIVLGNRLGTLTERSPRRRYGKVFIGPAAGARGLCFDVVLVPSLSERLFPHKVVEDPILPDEARRRISARSRSAGRARSAERLALRVAAGAARQRLLLSYPRAGYRAGPPARAVVLRAGGVARRRGLLAGILRTGGPGRGGTRVAARMARAGKRAGSDRRRRIRPRGAQKAGRRGSRSDDRRGALSADIEQPIRICRARCARARADGSSAGSALTAWSTRIRPRAPRSRAISSTARSYSRDRAAELCCQCPYRFFLQAIHRLEPREEPEAIEVIDPLTRGALFHEMQFEFAQRLARARHAAGHARRISTRRRIWLTRDSMMCAERYRDKLAPAIESVWDDGIAAIRADLREWLRADGAGRRADGVPSASSCPSGSKTASRPTQRAAPIRSRSRAG